MRNAAPGRPVSMTVRSHLFPFRTQKLSSLVPKIVGWTRPVKIGRCRLLKKQNPQGVILEGFCFACAPGGTVCIRRGHPGRCMMCMVCMVFRVCMMCMIAALGVSCISCKPCISCKSCKSCRTCRVIKPCKSCISCRGAGAGGFRMGRCMV